MTNRTSAVIATTAAAIVIPTFGVAQGATFFSSQSLFESTAGGLGKFMKGEEDFEGGAIGQGQILAIDDPLDAASSNVVYQPGMIESNLRLQSNIGGANSSTPSPRGVGGMAVVGAGIQGSTSTSVVANQFVDALDLIFLTQDKTAVGFDVVDFNPGTAGVRIDVYNTSNVLLGTTTVFGATGAGTFLGVIATPGQFIGRVNIFDTLSTPGIGAEGADNIQMWTAVPEPGTFVAMGVGLALLAALRRRK